MLRTIGLMVALVAAASLGRAEEMKAAEAARLVEGYFNSTKTMQAAFSQHTTGEAFTQEGMFYLSRTGSNPGKFLWDYQTPDKQRLIATGTALYFVDDANGGRVTELPIKAGLARLFAGKRLTLAKEGLQVERAAREDGKLKVDLRVIGNLGGDDTSGVRRVVLVFDEAPMQLREARVTDAVDAVTVMTFDNVQTGIALDDKMFRFVPRLKQI
ncbi:MAG: outer membrane lipoprotein carrier protein LolA [Pseudomonadaceae bacterium]|nr:outer membrane lipoprotein carrier protein LolA [Pseudomonadaceae bacterium]